MNIFRRFSNLWSPMCPSGLPHRVKIGVVVNKAGANFCWHSDCIGANIKFKGETINANKDNS